MKRKKLWLLALFGGGVSLVSVVLAASQLHRYQTGLFAMQQTAVLPPALAGLDLSQWPQECRALRRELGQPRSRGELRRLASSGRVTYDSRPIQPFVAPAWKLRWQGIPIAIPTATYRELILLRSASGLLTVALWGEGTGLMEVEPHSAAASRAGTPLAAVPVRVFLSQRPPMVEEVDVRTEIARLEGVELMPLRGRRRPLSDQRLTRQLFKTQNLSAEALADLAYQHRPEQIRCRLESWQADLPIALALKQMRQQEMLQQQNSETLAVYPRVGQAAGRVFRRRRLAEVKNANAASNTASNAVSKVAPRASTSTNPRTANTKTINPKTARMKSWTEWQAQIREPQNASDILISLPDKHPSATVGLALGQDNWWEARGRPAWLDALEQAIATDQASDWQRLALALERAHFSSDSLKSVQQLARPNAHRHDFQSTPSFPHPSTNPAFTGR